MNRKQEKNGKGRNTSAYRGKPNTSEPANANRKTDSRKPNYSRSHNDPNWYLHNGQLAKDVASVSFNNALGSAVVLNSSSPTLASYRYIGPGVMAIYNAPAPGYAGGANTAAAPVNVAARNIYSFVRHANSGHANYDSPDLMLYLLAMDSIYSYHAWMCRLYGIMNAFSRTNRYVGDALIWANSVNPDNIRANLANFRAYINQFAIKASAMCVPATMSYFTRHSWMYSSYYADENVQKSQFYIYVPAYLYKYNNGGGEGPGYLQPELLTQQIPDETTTDGMSKLLFSMTLTEIINYGNSLINAVLVEEDLNIMSGDILKAYGSDQMVRLPMIEEDYVVVPSWSEEVLAQIHNTDFIGVVPRWRESPETQFVTSINSFRVTQSTAIDTGYLNFQPYFLWASQLTYDRLLDHWKEDVSPEEVMVATRNMLTATRSSSTFYLNGCGSDVAFYAEIFRYSTSDGVITSTTHYRGDTAALVGQNTNLLCFNEYPTAYVVSDDRTYLSYLFGELSNYAVMSGQLIRDIHNCALLNMFGVPYIKG